jgi:hypothetical protein
MLTQAGIDLLRAAGIAADSPSCLLCLEADWGHCHRRAVAELMSKRWGFVIEHLGQGGGEP